MTFSTAFSSMDLGVAGKTNALKRANGHRQKGRILRMSAVLLCFSLFIIRLDC